MIVMGFCSRSLPALLLLLVAIPAAAHFYPADSTLRQHSFGVRLHGGVFMHHHPAMEIFRERPVRALELTYTRSGAPSKPWHRLFHGPWYGVKYLFMDLGSPTYLGYSHSLIPFIAIPFWATQGRFSLAHRWGLGLGYFTRVYHPTENFRNMAISTRFTPAVNLRLEARYRFAPGVATFVGMNLTHFSNGTFQKPNAGLNLVTMSLGATVALHHAPIGPVSLEPPPAPRHRLLVVGVASVKEERGVGGPKYGVGALALEYTRAWTPRFRYGLALDFMYDMAHGHLLEVYGHTPVTPTDVLRIGTAANLEVVLDRLSAGFYFGVYLHNVAGLSSPMYQRLGIRHRLNPRLWAHLMLKTHLGRADYVELGLAYRLF